MDAFGFEGAKIVVGVNNIALPLLVCYYFVIKIKIL